ncbi:Uncharacterised protein [Salmonella enterica subsp. enterica]|nr:Uncharacterised protein [Salmonella enterica subsp. enterica]
MKDTSRQLSRDLGVMGNLLGWLRNLIRKKLICNDSRTNELVKGGILRFPLSLLCFVNFPPLKPT